MPSFIVGFAHAKTITPVPEREPESADGWGFIRAEGFNTPPLGAVKRY